MLTIEQIIALLQTKFAGVRKDGLAQLAKFIKLNATNQEEAQALVDGYTPEVVTEFVTDWRKDVDKEVNTGVKTAEGNFKKKYNVTDPVEEAKTPVVTPTVSAPSSSDDLAALIQATMKPIMDEITALKSGNVSTLRNEQLNTKMANAPQAFKDRVSRDYNRMSFENDEAFTGYLTELDTDLANYNQEVNNQSLSSFGRPVVSGGDNNAVPTAVEQYVKESQSGIGANSLGGKEL